MAGGTFTVTGGFWVLSVFPLRARLRYESPVCVQPLANTL